ncbi:MAG: TolC family protein [Cyclobacteriaceae bacterium]
MKYLLFTVLITLNSIAHSQWLPSTDFKNEIGRITAILNNQESIDSLVERAYQASGLLKAFDQEIGIYKEEIVQKSRNWANSFRLGVNIFSANTSYSLDNESITTIGVLPNVGLSLVIDPEKVINRKSYMRQASHKRDRSIKLQEDHKQRIRLEVLNHYYQYLSLLECLVLQEHTLNTRKQHLDVLEVEFRNGSATYDELLVVQNQYNLWEEQITKNRIATTQKRHDIEVILGLKRKAL